MKLQSTRFGELEIEESQILTFAQGIPGFLEEKSFALLPGPADTPFLYLQSCQDADLTFVLLDIFAVFKDYEFRLDDAVVKALELSQDNLPAIYNIVNVPAKTEDMTVNLAAPVVVHPETRQAMQVILHDTQYSTRHRLFPAPVAKAAQGGR